MDIQYGNVAQLVSRLYQKLETLPSSSDNAASLQMQHLEIEGILTALVAQGQDIYVNTHMCDKILTKYPESLVQQICTEELLDLKTFQEKIDRVIRTRKTITAVKSLEPVATLPKALTAALLTSNTPTTKTKSTLQYIFCQEAHYNSNCSKYPTRDER